MSTGFDISDCQSAIVEVDVDASTGMEGNDYIRCYYTVDGGPEILLDENGDLTDDFTGPLTARSAGISGNILSIVIRCHNGAGTEYHYFDNVAILKPVGSSKSTVFVIR